MEVILLEKIKGLGEIGSIVEVKPGFARNYLIPNKKVLRATSRNKQIVEDSRVLLQQQNADKKIEAEKNAATLYAVKAIIVRQAGEDGRLYGSVSARDIAKAILEVAKVKIGDDNITITNRIKEIGLHTVAIALHPDVLVNFDVVVARSEQEADALLQKLV